MKLAYPFGTPETAAPLLGYRGDPDHVFPLLKDLGYTALEPFVRDPKLFDTRLLQKKAAIYGLEIAAIGTGPVVSDDKLTFTAKDEQVRAEAIRRAKEMAELASLFGCQVNVGKLRGDIDKGQPETSWAWMEEGFRQLCEHADPYGVPITLEPQNKMIINNLNSTQEALAFINRLQIPNLRLMLDVFHMNLEDQSLAASFIEAGDQLVHIHFADSNRLSPGKGNLNFKEIIRILKALKYDRCITLEVSQLPDSFTAAKTGADYLKFIISED
jgi:sugar phosphate isomerase/epimerase